MKCYVLILIYGIMKNNTKNIRSPSCISLMPNVPLQRSNSLHDQVNERMN